MATRSYLRGVQDLAKKYNLVVVQAKGGGHYKLMHNGNLVSSVSSTTSDHNVLLFTEKYIRRYFERRKAA